MSSVQEALKAREKRKKQEQEESLARIQAKIDKTNSAVEAYRKRQQSNAQNATTDIAKRINAEIETIKTVSTPSWGSDALRNTLDSTRENRVKVGKLQQELESYKSYLDEETYNKFSSTLDSIRKSYDSYLGVAEGRSQFDSEDAYNEWYEAYETQQEEQQAILGSEDFEEYYQKGKTDDDNNDFIMEIFGKPVGESNYIEHYRKYYADPVFDAESYGGGVISENASFALAMTEDEVKIYDYYLAKEGKKKAKEYLDSIAETVNKRVATGIYENLGENKLLEVSFAATAGLEQFISGVGNLDNLIMGTEADTTSAVQYASSMVREDMNGGWGVAYDLANAAGNMLPSILVGSLTGSLGGALTLGAGAAGNGYAEMRKLGYDEGQSRGYGLLVGASEAGLSYLLGGISKLGGKISGNAVSKFVAKFDNALARTAIQLGGNMASEGLEEAIQTVLEPAIKALMTGEDFESPEWDEVLYSALLGALSAGVFEGVPTVAGEVKTYKEGKNLKQDASAVDKLTKLGKTFSADTVAYQIAGKVNAQTNAYTIGRLLNEVGATLSEQNLTEIANGLTARGMNAKVANKLAKQYQTFLNNEMRMTDEQVKTLESLSPLADVLRANIIGTNTTAYQKTRDYSDIMSLANEISNGKNSKETKTEKTATEPVNPSINIFEQNDINTELQRIASEVAAGSRVSESERTIKNVVNAANSVAKEKLGVEGRYKSSDTGATRLDSNKQKVNIVGVDSVEDGTMKLELDDGSIVDADEINFSTSDQALVYEAVTYMGVSANTAWEILKGYDSKSGQSGGLYAMGALEAYTYGHNGVKVDGMSKDGFSAFLSYTQKNTANKLGDIDARAKINAQQQAIDQTVKSVRDEAKSKHKAIPKRNGAIVFDGDRARLTDLQRSQFDVLEKVAGGLGVTFHIFESRVDAEGKRYYTMPDGTITSANGWYDVNTGEIWIDLYAGDHGQGTIIFTASHELTHFIRQWSPAKFKVFADFLFEQYGKKGQDVKQLIEAQIRKAANNGRSISWDEAYEEVVADSAETFLRDSKAAEKIAALRERDASLANKIKSFLGQMLAKMRKLMADLGLAPETNEGQMVAKMTDSLQKLYNLWTDALADAGEAYSSLVEIDSKTESVSPLFSERTWTASEYVTEREETAKKIVKALGVDIKTAYKYIDDINGVARLIADDRARLDYEPNLDEKATVLKPNSEYKYSVDMSTLCAKRLLFTGTFDAIQRALPNTVFDSEDIVALREMMQKRDYEVACGICYVESTRREIGRITQEFIDRYKVAQETGEPISRINSSGKEVVLKSAGRTFSADKNYTPNLGELNTTDIDIVKRDHREVYDAYLAFMNARGQAKPKLLETRAEYKGEILNHFKAKSAVEARNNAGGLRLQSFSDFEVPHMIDMMQIVMDMSRVGLKSQAYTKVPAFAEIFGDTGVKINLSLIAKGDGLDSKGNLIFDDVEGINHEEAFRLRDKFSKNVGTILVGKTDAHIIAAMADPRIDYIIPFHKSSWKESLYDALGLTGYADYTDFQNEKPIDKDRKIKNYDPSEYWDFTKSGDENAQIYLEKCREDGRIPKFPQFQGYPGYWKLLIDFKMYDNNGVGSPQEVVKPAFNTEASERILSEYKGGHKSFPVAKDVVEDFVKEYKDKVKYSDRATNPYDGKTLYADSEVYDYSFLVSLEPMTVKTMPPLSTVKVDGRISQERTIELGLKNAASIGVKIADGQYAVKNAYTKRDIILGKGGLKHSIDASNTSRLRTNARLSAIGGYIVQNAVPINGLTKENKQANGTYAMACLLNDGNGFVVAIVTVDEFSSRVTKFDFVEITHSINGRFLAKKEDSRSSTRELELGEKSLSTTAISEISIADFLEIVNSSHQSILSNNVLAHFGETRNPDGHYAKRVLFSDRASYAPTFYSYMGKVIDDIKLDKMGAGGVVSYLKGKGVKNEEIKWSGIETFLEGKKSVTKADLQEFVAGSQLQIAEQMSGDDIDLRYDGSERAYNLYDSNGKVVDTFTYNQFLGGYVAESDEEIYSNDIEIRDAMRETYGKASAPKWADYTIDGGTNYRELVFVLPNASHSNRAMRVHWGQDAEGVLAHARIQDINVDGKKMLFIEEIQSDWHNEGHEKGYTTSEYEDAVAVYDKLVDDYTKKRQAFNKYVRSGEFRSDPDEVSKKKFDWLRRKMDEAEKRMQDAERDINALKEKGMGDVPDAPFRDTYHEYVLKRLLRMAAEEGYDSIGWTPADIQSERWSDEFAEGYRIEYDQDIPKFLRKYGKKWGATVGKTKIPSLHPSTTYYDVNREETYSLLEWREEVESNLKAQGAPMRNVMYKVEGEYYIVYDKVSGMEYDRAEIRKTSDSVWSMDIPDSMTESVLYEGQVMYSDRVTDKKTLNFLENQEHITTYKSFVEIDGKLYSPMATKVKGEDGKYHLTKPSELGVWQQAEEKPDSIPKFHKSGYGYYVLKKDDGGSVTAAYNPYEHSSNLVLNDQFEAAYQRPNLVTVECVIPKSEMTSGYKAKYAKDSTGYLDWKSGTVAGKLKGNKRKVYLSRWLKPVRIVSDAEVASMYKDLLGSNISVPFNVVTPQLLTELEKVGVKIDYEGSPGYQYRQSKKQPDEGAKYSDRNPDSISNRSLLANALESVAKNDIERNKLNEYKKKIALIESEQAKLAELKGQIKELSFAKGKRDTEAIKKLQFEANQAASRINTYDRQLLTLEATSALKGVLDREKQMAYKKAEREGKEALARYREKAAQTQRELLVRASESRKKGIESRHKTEMRHKIKDVVNELNQYLLKGTKDKHVPIELQKAVAEALDAVNMDTVGAEERIAKLQAELRAAKTLEDMQAITKKIEHIQEMGGNMEAKLSRLKTAYDGIINSDDPLVANSHDEVISNTIGKVIEIVGSTPLRDMSLYQLEAVYDMYKMVLTTVRNTNKAFKAKKSEDISIIANRVMEEIDNIGQKKLYTSKASQFASKFDWNNLKPVYAFERIGSDTFTEVFNNVRAGEDTWAVDISEAKDFSTTQHKKYKYDSWDFKKRYGFTSSSGKDFELSLDQIMSLYAYSKREQAKEHLKRGGIVIDETTEITVKNKLGIPVKFNPTQATAYNLSDETLADIISKLTPDQREFVDVMQDYLSTTMGEKGNEVSLELYGVKLYKEKNYFPLKSATQFMAKAKEQQKGEVKIKNSGFSKETAPKASNPIVLTPFMDVWADHVNEMSMYHAFVLALEDFYRVYNYKTPTSDTMATESVEMYLQNAFGKAATQYVDQLLRDLNGGARVDSTAGVINKLTGLFKKSAVFASASVVVQQPSAIARATALVDSKYFVGVPSGKHRETWAEIKKYAPVAVIKEMGYFDTGMGQSTVEWIKGEKTWKDKVDDVASKAPALADELAWGAIWKAIKRETLHTHKNLQPNSEAFLKAVGERFTEVIIRTQVYDSVLARSANMRSKDTGMKMATAFMGEPTTSLNMLENALTQGKRGNKRYARKAIGSVVASMILNSILVSIVYAGRDDDEDKTYAEKYIGTLTEELIDSLNPLTLIPFVKDIVSIVQGYDVERSDMAVITDLINAWNNLDSDNRSAYRKVEDFGGAVASIFGLPVKNVMRDVRGMYNTINSFINGNQTTGEGMANAIKEGITGKEVSDSQQLYEAILSGDSEQIKRVKGRFKDQNAINSAIRKALRENDPRIKEAAGARYNGDIAEYMRIAKAIIAEGNFKQDDIVAAINSEISALKKGEESTTTSTDTNKVASIYKMDDYYAALVGRDQATAYVVKEDLIKTDVANGKDREEAEADFNSRFASYLREQYEDGEISGSTAKSMLVNYGGKSEEDADSKIQYWDFKKEYPDYDLSEEAVKKYYEEVEPYGIGISTYYDYTKQRAKCKGTDTNGDGRTDSGSVKAEVLHVINSLPISNKQKDALYYLNGWSAKTIYEAPWH